MEAKGDNGGEYVELKDWWKKYTGEKLYLEPSQFPPIAFEHKEVFEQLSTAMSNPKSEG